MFPSWFPILKAADSHDFSHDFTISRHWSSVVCTPSSWPPLSAARTPRYWEPYLGAMKTTIINGIRFLVGIIMPYGSKYLLRKCLGYDLEG